MKEDTGKEELKRMIEELQALTREELARHAQAVEKLAERIETIEKETKKAMPEIHDDVVMTVKKDGYTALLNESGRVVVMQDKTQNRREHQIQWESQPTQETATRALRDCIEGLTGRQRGYVLAFVCGTKPEQEYEPITNDTGMER